MNYNLEFMLEKLNIDKVVFDLKYNKYTEYKTLKKEDLLRKGFNEEIINDIEDDFIDYCTFISEIGFEYLKIVFEKDFIVSIEDISLLFDVSIRYATTEIAPYLDRITFPTSELDIKSDMKSNLSQYFKLRHEKVKNRFLINNNIKSEFSSIYSDSFVKDLLRKKVLFSVDSLSDYCKENIILESSYTSIILNKSEILTSVLAEKWNYKEHTSIQNMIKDSFERFINFKIENTKYINIENNFDFKNYIKSEVMSVYFTEYYTDTSKMKSTNSLRVLFDKVYSIEILRMFESKAFNCLSFKVGRNKKYMRRYIIQKEDLRRQFDKNNFTKEDCQKLRLLKNALKDIFNNDVEKVLKEYNDFIINNATR